MGTIRRLVIALAVAAGLLAGSASAAQAFDHSPCTMGWPDVRSCSNHPGGL